jgi:hypothetical protein
MDTPKRRNALADADDDAVGSVGSDGSGSGAAYSADRAAMSIAELRSLEKLRGSMRSAAARGAAGEIRRRSDRM